MPGTLAVRSLIDGRVFVFAGLSASEAADALRETLRIDGATAEVLDLLPDLRENFPLGARVILGPRVYWKRGARGTVTEDKAESFAVWPDPPEVTPWCIDHSGASVSVRVDGDDSPSWWPASWLERI